MRTKLQEKQVTTTSLCNGCSEEPLAPTAVLLVVTSSGEGLGHLEAEYTRNRRAPSSAVQCTGPVEADQGKADEHRCSAAVGVLGEGGCGIVAVNRSWSSEVARQTSVQECSSEGAQAQGWVHWANEGTGVAGHGYLQQSCCWGEDSLTGSRQNRVCDVYWPYPTHVRHLHLSDHQGQ